MADQIFFPGKTPLRFLGAANRFDLRAFAKRKNGHGLGGIRTRGLVMFWNALRSCKSRALPLRHEPVWVLQSALWAECSPEQKKARQTIGPNSVHWLFSPSDEIFAGIENCRELKGKFPPKVGFSQPIGGDLTAGSPTVTLLRLNPPHLPLARLSLITEASLKASLDGLTGGVCKEQGHIHRAMMTRDY